MMMSSLSVPEEAPAQPVAQPKQPSSQPNRQLSRSSLSVVTDSSGTDMMMPSPSVPQTPPAPEIPKEEHEGMVEFKASSSPLPRLSAPLISPIPHTGEPDGGINDINPNCPSNSESCEVSAGNPCDDVDHDDGEVKSEVNVQSNPGSHARRVSGCM